MDRNTNDTIESILFTILLPILSLGCSIGINFLEQRIGFVATIVMLLIILIGIGVSIKLASFIVTHIGGVSLESKIDLGIKQIQENVANNKIMNGIIKETQLALMERTCKFEEIWLISPDLLTEINDGIYAGVVNDNLRKGTKYKYFVPDTDINKVRVKIFQDSCRNSRNLEIYYLSDDFFFVVPHVDFAIYEPMKSMANGKRGYMGLPIQGLSESFAVLMNNDFVDAVIGKLAERINQ